MPRARPDDRQPEPCPGLLDPAAPCVCEPREIDVGGVTVRRYPHGRGTA